MDRTRIGLWLTMVLVIVSISEATKREVPYPYPTIQLAITAAVDGDTVSVWGPPPGQPPVPPWTYYENVDYLGKSIFVVNRSFLPNETSYDSSWDWVVIDGQQNGPTASKFRR